MASVTHRLRKHLRWQTPNPALAVLADEGLRLARRLSRAAKAVGADPLDYLAYLHQMRRGYDPKHDGKSDLMDLVDAIGSYEVREQLRRKQGANGSAS